MAVSQTKDGRWFCYYRQDGKTKREYFGREPGAHGEALQRDDEIRHNKGTGKPSRNHSPIFQEVAVAYQKAKFSKQSFVSRQNLYYKLKGVIFCELGHLPVMQITNNRLDSYVLKRLKTKVPTKEGNPVRFVKRTTVHRELSDIRAIINWAVKRRIIDHSPMHDYEFPHRDDEIITPPSREEIRAILSYAAPHLIKAIILSYYVGLRPGAVELLGILWDDINWQDKTILIRAAKKGGRPTRTVPWHQELEVFLHAWAKADNTGCIIKFQGEPIKSVRSAWAAAKKRAGITRRLRMYDIRHAFVTSLLEEGADLQTVAELAGHNIDTMIKSYQHITQRLRNRTITQLPGLGNTVLPKDGE